MKKADSQIANCGNIEKSLHTYVCMAFVLI